MAVQIVDRGFGDLITPCFPMLLFGIFYRRRLPNSNLERLSLHLCGSGGMVSRLKFGNYALLLVFVNIRRQMPKEFFLQNSLFAKNALHLNRSKELISRLECQLASLVSKEAEGVKIRSRAQWFEEGEKPTRYFFSPREEAYRIKYL